MDLLASSRTNRPARAQRKIMHKSSTPIEIPKRQRHNPSPVLTPIIHGISPDLLFDMSPVNLSSTPDPLWSPGARSGAQQYSTFVHRTARNKAASLSSTSKSPPFMYQFPRTTTHHHHRNVKAEHSLSRSSSPLFCSSNMPVEPANCRTSCSSSPQNYYLTSAFDADIENSFSTNSKSQELHNVRGRALSRRTSFSDRACALVSPASILPRGRAIMAQSFLASPFSTPDEEIYPIEDLESDRAVEIDSHTKAVLDVHLNPFDIGFGKHLTKRTVEERKAKLGLTRVIHSVTASVES